MPYTRTGIPLRYIIAGDGSVSGMMRGRGKARYKLKEHGI